MLTLDWAGLFLEDKMKKLNGRAVLIKVDGTIIAFQKNKPFELKEMCGLIGCEMIEIVNTIDGRLMVLDEEGKLKNKEINWGASSLYEFADQDKIVGDVLICDQGLIE
jgi:hypothetical protein